MTPQPTRISVALCTYNGEKYIAGQLQSIWDQTRPPDELIVADDCSADGTLEAVRAFLDAHPRLFPVRLLTAEQNRGVIGNFSRAIAACGGELIFPCDQDDIWLPEKIETLARVFDAHPECTVAFSDAALVDAEGRDLGRTLWQSLDFAPGMIGARYRNMLELLLNRCVVTGTAMAFRRGLLQIAEPFSSNWIHDGWLAVLAACTGELLPVDRKLVLYRQHGGNVVGANKNDPVSRGRRYLGNFARMEQIRRRRRGRYADVLERLRQAGFPESEDTAALRRCVAFWDRMLELDGAGFFRGCRIILSALAAHGYRRYYSGFKGAARDFACLLRGKGG